MLNRYFVDTGNPNLANNVTIEDIDTHSYLSFDIWISSITISMLIDSNNGRWQGWGTGNNPLSNGFYIDYRTDTIPVDHRLTIAGKNVTNNHDIMHFGNSRTVYDNNGNMSIVSTHTYNPPFRIKSGSNSRMRLVRGINNYGSGNVEYLYISYNYYLIDT